MQGFLNIIQSLFLQHSNTKKVPV